MDQTDAAMHSSMATTIISANASMLYRTTAGEIGTTAN